MRVADFARATLGVDGGAKGGLIRPPPLTGNRDMRTSLRRASLVAALCAAGAAGADEQAAIDGCIDALRATGTPDAQGGEVVSSEFSQAGTLVMLRDAGGTLWRCIGYNDGAVGELVVAEGMDDGGGAMAGAGASGGDGDLVANTRQVRFAPGTSGAEYSEGMDARSIDRYVLGARDGQNLYVRVATDSPGVSYRILNPDGSALLDDMSPDREYRGQLWQSGDHVVEVINRGGDVAQYNVIFGVD
jgi:hypothetical protein